MEDKTYQVKEYDDFPFKKDNDEVVAEYKKLETAQYESIWLNKRARMGERYYVMDNPHEWKTLSNREREVLIKKFPQLIGK